MTEAHLLEIEARAGSGWALEADAGKSLCCAAQDVDDLIAGMSALIAEVRTLKAAALTTIAQERQRCLALARSEWPSVPPSSFTLSQSYKDAFTRFEAQVLHEEVPHASREG